MIVARQAGAALALLVLFAPGARSADDEAIREAIRRGVEFLKGQQDRASGAWRFHEATTGATSLAGLTLLECGVAADDGGVQRAADSVRRDSINLTHTYSLSLAILFLDRLGDPEDGPFIQSMTVRLLAGQNSAGGWTYDCPPISRDEVSRLTRLLRARKDRSGPSGAAGQPAGGATGARLITREIRRQLDTIDPRRRPASFSDNSNTKFATLALWIGRRHGMPVEKALALVEKRFRGSQNADGGWGYLPARAGDRGRLSESLASMTCAGLLGLAVGRGAAGGNHRDPEQDPAIRRGLALIASVIGQPLPANDAGRLLLFGTVQGDEYYFLWALERMAVTFDLRTIRDKDWYAWGAEYLLSRQERDGGWRGKYAEGGVDTCFALLFLRRANLSRDLTVRLRGQRLDPAFGGPRPEDPPRDKPPPEKPAPPPKTDAPPPADAPSEKPVEEEAARLSKELVRALTDHQAGVLERFRDNKGVAYTQALAAAIPQLTGQDKSGARDALTERLTRMTSATLRGRLADENTEIRRSAALASGTKEEPALIPDLIPLLEDGDAGVAKGAQVALRHLSGKDFGPAAGASASDRAKAVAAWKKWWESRKNDAESDKK